jgi:hypothetical protein
MFPAYDPEIGKRHLAGLDREVFDPASGKMVITYQTYVVRTPKHTILIDTCTGEDKGYPPPMDFPKQPWLDGFQGGRPALRGHRLRVLHAPAHRPYRLEHGAAQRPLGADLPEGEIHLPQSANTPPGKESDPGAAAIGPPGNVWRYNCEPVVAAGQALLVDDDYQLDDTLWLTPTPGHSPCHCCVNIRSRGQHAVVIGDLMHHALQCREPDWSTIFDWDREGRRALAPKISRRDRRHRQVRAADPFSPSDHRPHRGGRPWRGASRRRHQLE